MLRYNKAVAEEGDYAVVILHLFKRVDSRGVGGTLRAFHALIRQQMVVCPLLRHWKGKFSNAMVLSPY